MTKVHALFIQENPYNLHVGDTVKVEANHYKIKKFGFVSSISVYYSNMGEPYYIYNITSKEKEIVYNSSVRWVSDASLLTSSDHISSLIQKKMLLTERIKK